jgi:hypothetical protein
MATLLQGSDEHQWKTVRQRDSWAATEVVAQTGAVRRPFFLTMLGVIRWTMHGARHAQLPPTGGPEQKRQSLTGGAAPK